MIRVSPLLLVYDYLLAQHGKQSWWPAETRFEVMVGAILTQNTAWKNVEHAIHNLQWEQRLSAQSIVKSPDTVLAKCIRPSGYFNVKAKRLKAFCRWYIDAGGLEKLKYWPTAQLRKALIAVPGIGPETADDILLYAFERPIFVIDAYTRRIFSRLGCVGGEEPYEQLRSMFQKVLDGNARFYNEYHALIVNHGKNVCQTRPRCNACSLRPLCMGKTKEWKLNNFDILTRPFPPA